jgi:hypothetical protein
MLAVEREGGNNDHNKDDGGFPYYIGNFRTHSIASLLFIVLRDFKTNFIDNNAGQADHTEKDDRLYQEGRKEREIIDNRHDAFLLYLTRSSATQALRFLI